MVCNELGFECICKVRLRGESEFRRGASLSCYHRVSMHNLPLPIAAFVAGLLSFLSPCVLPLVPGYVSLISGTGVEGLKDADAPLMRRVMFNSLMFISGFSLVFIGLGAVATSIGQ